MGVCNPKVSVVVPAYNQDGCIMRTIKSIQNQTLEDIEIIVVDCGSDDRTYDIAERITHRDIRLDAYRLDGVDIADAREFGLSKATGKYVYLIYPGDWLEPKGLEDMVSFAQDNSLDLVVTGLFVDTSYNNGEGSLTEIYSTQINCVYTEVEDFRRSCWELLDEQLFDVLSNKLYLTSLIKSKDIRFTSNSKEDLFFTCDYVQQVEHVGVLQRSYPHISLSREAAAARRWNPGLYENREREYTRLMDMYKAWGLELDALSMGVVHRIYLESIIECIESVCSPKCILSATEKRRLIDKMISSDRAQVAASVIEPKSRMMQMMLGPIKNKNVGLVYSEGRFISFIKRRNTKMFASFKADK